MAGGPPPGGRLLEKEGADTLAKPCEPRPVTGNILIRRERMNRLVIGLIVLALAGGGAYWYMNKDKAAAPADPAAMATDPAAAPADPAAAPTDPAAAPAADGTAAPADPAAAPADPAAAPADGATPPPAAPPPPTDPTQH